MSAGRVRVVLPSVMAGVTGGERRTEVTASKLGEVIDRLVEKYGEPFRVKIYDSPGRLRRLLNFYVNGKNAHYLGGLEAELKDGDEVSILPAVSGG